MKTKIRRILFLAVLLVTAYATLGESVMAQSPLQIGISTSNMVSKTGDKLVFETTTTYNGEGTSPPLIAAMNIVNLEDGAPVDPEDWSPQRTQTIPPLAQGESSTEKWIIYSILSGNYLAYIVSIPKPDTPEASSVPVSSPGLHLTVHEYVRLNPRGILPLLIGMPVFLAILFFTLFWIRRRQIEP
jgi:hypothetical protein